MLSQLLSGVPQLSTPSTTHTVSRGGNASLSQFGATFMFKAATRVRAGHGDSLMGQLFLCHTVNYTTIHFTDFNLHGR